MISLLLLLINCGNSTKEIEIKSKPVEIVIVQPTSPAPVYLQNITWKVVEKDGLIYYAISIQDYQKLSQNMLELKRFIIEDQAIIDYYKNVTNSEGL